MAQPEKDDALGKLRDANKLKMVLNNEGLLAAVFTNHPDWAMSIWNQPCLVMPSEVADGTVYDTSTGEYIPSQSVSGAQRIFAGDNQYDFLKRLLLIDSNNKSRGPAGQLLLGLMRELLGLIFYNPWLYWKQINSPYYFDKWRSTLRDPLTDEPNGLSP